MKVQALVFDFGGVFTFSDVTRDRLRRYDAQLGLPPDSLMAALFSGEAWELRSTGRIGVDEYWARCGQPYEDRLPRDFRDYREGMFWGEPNNEAMVALACRLRRRYSLALCSNALPELAGILRSRPDLAGLFEVTIISALVGLRKPDPAIYRLTAERLGLPLAACLLVDDKVRNTDAASAAGMPVVVFLSAGQLAADLETLGLLP